MATRNDRGRFTARTDEQKAKEARAYAYAKAIVETGSESYARAAEAAATPRPEMADNGRK